MDIREEIFKFVSKHEVIIANQMKEDDIKANFTTFGNRAACRAINDILVVLSDDERQKVIEMMKNKKC
jgi:hypothetical protein